MNVNFVKGTNNLGVLHTLNSSRGQKDSSNLDGGGQKFVNWAFTLEIKG